MKDHERMIVSAHLDHEVEAPWRDEVDRRIAGDPGWAAEAERHRAVKAALAADPEPDFRAAQARVADRLAHTPVAPKVTSYSWVSIGAAAAALLLLAAGAGFWMGRQSAGNAPSALAELQVKVPQQLELKLTGEGQLLMASTTERTAP